MHACAASVCALLVDHNQLDHNNQLDVNEDSAATCLPEPVSDTKLSKASSDNACEGYVQGGRTRWSVAIGAGWR